MVIRSSMADRLEYHFHPMARSSKRSSFDPRQARGSMFQDALPLSAQESPSQNISDAGAQRIGEEDRCGQTGEGIAGDREGEGGIREEVGGGVGGVTVTQVASLIKQVLADHTPMPIRVVGEISNFSFRTHAFFSLKDAQASLRCVCFATACRRLNFSPSDGMQVVASGRLDYFPGQGNIQLYVDRIEPIGQGGLELELRRLMQELRELGYFDEERKKPLPTYPQTIAVVTSRTGAAIQDVINTAKRRWAGCRLLLVDVRVQGAGAAPEIAAAIDALSRHGPRQGVEAIILTRGGGSIEDLWAFNERLVADAVYRCPLPIVAAIGHETDTTIAELVADRRASTPTQAAMMLVPDAQAMEQQLDQVGQRLSLLVQRSLRQQKQHLAALASRPLFSRPEQLLWVWRQSLDRLTTLLGATLPHRAAAAQQRLALCRQRIRSAMASNVQQQSQMLTTLERQLQAMNPRHVLDRGYSYTLGPDGLVLQDPAKVNPGDAVVSVLAKGRLRTIVPLTMPDASGLSARGDERVSLPDKRQTKNKRAKKEDGQPGLF